MWHKHAADSGDDRDKAERSPHARHNRGDRIDRKLALRTALCHGRLYGMRNTCVDLATQLFTLYTSSQ